MTRIRRGLLALLLAGLALGAQACPLVERPGEKRDAHALLGMLAALPNCVGDAAADANPLTAAVHNALGAADAATGPAELAAAVRLLAKEAADRIDPSNPSPEWQLIQADLNETASSLERMAQDMSAGRPAAPDSAIRTRWQAYTAMPKRPLRIRDVAIQPVAPVDCAAADCPAFESRRQMLRVIHLMAVVERRADRPVLREQLAKGRLELLRWEAYRTQSQHQYFWELYVNSRRMAGDSSVCPRTPDGALKGFCSVPTDQWIVLHPDAGLQWSRAAKKSSELKPAFIVELIGRHSFEWKDANSAEMHKRRGWSIAAAYSKPDDAKGHWGFGPMLHYEGYNLAITRAPGERWGVMINLRLADRYFARKDDWTQSLRLGKAGTLFGHD